jgi:ABC-type nitrate/sulfonate/bicarbonate transport system permease component
VPNNPPESRGASAEAVTPPWGAEAPGRRTREGWERVLALSAPVLLLVLWEAATRSGVLDKRFFPAPSQIAETFRSLLESGELPAHTWASVRRVLIGFAIGAAPAVVLGLLIGFLRPLRLVLNPIIAALYPVPKSAIAPLLLLIFGFEEESKWVLVAIGAFFPVVLNTAAGVMQIDRVYYDVAKNFGAGRLQFFATVALPGALPNVMTGLRLGLGMGMILIAVAEIVGAKSGLGFMIWNSWQVFQVEPMYVGLIMIAALGVIFTFVLEEVERLLIPWRRP